ncbi:MAG: putative surface layer protein [Chlamydiia bacterium]|nr:putative surface layer protein [Chlamydiia bacterium]
MKFLHFLFIFLLITVKISSGLPPPSVAPIITGISPSHGSTAGGDTVTITGSGFTGITSVQFDTSAATSYIINSDNSITAISPPGTPGTVDITATASGGTSTASSLDRYTYQGELFGFIAVGTGATIFQTSTGTIENTLTFSGTPSSVAITRDGKSAYFTLATDDAVAVVDIATETLLTTITLPSGSLHPASIAISPTEDKAYVVNSDSNTVVSIDLSTNTPGTAISGSFSGPIDIAFTPDGSIAYVVNSGSSTVVPIDTANETVGAPIVVGTGPNRIAIAPDGLTAYVTSSGGGVSEVTSINLLDNSTASITHIGNRPLAIAITPDGSAFYVTNANGGTITPYTIGTQTVEGPIPVGVQPNGIAITPNGLRGYVTNQGSSSFSTVDLTTSTLVTTLGDGTPSSIAIMPDQAPIASFTATIADAGSPTSFNATDSFSPVGEIASYDWDFGDGDSSTTTSPTTIHTYATAGTFTATLTVTNTNNTSTTQTFTGHTVSNNGGPLATASQFLTISSPTPTPTPTPSLSTPTAPKRFTGKIEHRGAKSHHKFKLKTKWKASSSTDVVSYKIYAGKHLVRTISSDKARVFKRHLHPMPFYKIHLHDYKKFLHRRYTIRAVSSTGAKSSSVRLQIQ